MNRLPFCPVSSYPNFNPKLIAHTLIPYSNAMQKQYETEYPFWTILTAQKIWKIQK